MALLRSIVFILILIGFQTSCEKKWFEGTVDCEECYQIKPDSADLVVHLTFNNDITEIPIIVYKGYMDNYKIEWIDTAYESPFYLYVPVKKFFTVTAEYKLPDKTIIAVDGTKIKLKKVTSECDEECWVIENTKVNTRLKY